MNGEPDPYCDEILSGKLSVDVVLNTEQVLAFHHPSPSFTPLQIIVIPKTHVLSIADLADSRELLALDLMKALARVSGEVAARHGAARVVTNLGDLQHSRHLHWHVIVNPERQAPSSSPTPADLQWRTYWSERRWEPVSNLRR